MCYSGGIKAEKCVSVGLRNYIFKHVTKVECYNDRLLFVKIIAKPVDIVIMQVYMPKANHDDEIEKI
jgi:hypothetical protein